MKKLIYILGLTAFMASCGGEEVEYNDTPDDGTIEINYDQLKGECEDLESRILSGNGPQDSLLKAATTRFQDFTGAFPEDPEAPDYLLKASDFAYTLAQYEKSVKILDRIIKEYPEYKRMEDVMFVKASHIDLNLRDTTRAKQAYQDFMAKYPESEMIDDAQSRIENIGLSIEELAEKFAKELEENPQ
ncbi:MAG: outer membrane protein assembly factor BamD [Crocinitomicaceae bacterium]|nr:outer membrane protein assembly factor BamD [Crocinitomicaceae bacterium]